MSINYVDKEGLEAAVEAIKARYDQHVVNITITQDSWTGSAAPYSRNITCAGMTDAIRPRVEFYNTTGASAANFKADKKAVACIDQWVSGTDVLTLQCYTSKPTTNIGVRIIW